MKEKQVEPLSDTSTASYSKRLNTMLKRTKAKDADDLLLNPDKYYPILHESMQRYWKRNGKPESRTTMTNFGIAICSYYTHNRKGDPTYDVGHGKWKTYMTNDATARDEHFSKNLLPEEKLEKVVNVCEVIDRYNAMKDDTECYLDEKKHRQLVLLATFVHLQPKRADLGNVYLYTQPEKRSDVNYIVLNETGGYLVLNKYKTAKTYGPLEEQLPNEYVEFLKRSLIFFPRETLFVDSKGKPYIKNDSYGTFASRTFDELFGKNMGVSLWRHVHTNQRVDYNKDSIEELKRNARLMGHSLQQQMGTYRYVNGV
jgi:hypothetical protein